MASGPFNRRTLLAGLSALLAWPLRVLAAARPPKQVLAFYYGWYGSPGHTTLDDAPDKPVGGPYDGFDPAVIARQMGQAKSAGLTGLIASWWGPGEPTDKQFPLLLDAAQKAGLSVAPYVEQADTPEKLSDDILYLHKTYNRHQAWLLLDGRRVVFLYDRVLQTIGLDGWKAAKTRIEAAAPGFFAFVATGNGAHQIAERAPFVDGIHIYDMAFYAAQNHLLDLNWPGGFYKHWVEVQSGLKVTTATILPGYDDSHVEGRPYPRPYVGRGNGHTFNRLFDAAIAAKPDWILIVSFNEWHEGSEIEPSTQYGDVALQSCAKRSARFLAG